ncbi:hypothetical protein [Turicimonas muris]|uniref:hypothetical protein n=1 Tax=Turicimonas muris TaxID=1796652 RepID=UPI0024953356|nr:hypothetical protein [Turicimonas muris]
MNPKFIPPHEFEKYKKYLKAMAALSGLFGTDAKPYINYRFVEKLFIKCCPSAVDYTRQDNSFDAKVGKAGVGIKTFVSRNSKQFSPIGTDYKHEKVAEFTKWAKDYSLASMIPEELAQEVSELRNARVQSDCGTCGIDIKKSIYHCLIRFPQKAIVHEEPYPLIDIDNIIPCDSRFKKVKHFSKDITSDVNFYDGHNFYKYSRSKNVLYKKFVFNLETAPAIDLSVKEDPFEVLLSLLQTSISQDISMSKTSDPFVVLPLFSLRGGKQVPLQSGINAWNADGRPRNFGEAYIPVPSWIYKEKSDIMPLIDPKGPLDKSNAKRIDLHLPNGVTVSAKLCQSDLKGLMSKDNTDLVRWIFATIDGSFQAAKAKRFQSTTIPYTLADLKRIGKDSVALIKHRDGSYSLVALPYGSYEKYRSDPDGYTSISDFYDIEETDGSEN